MPPLPGEDRPEPTAGRHRRRPSTAAAEGGHVEATADEQRGQPEAADEQRGQPEAADEQCGQPEAPDEEREQPEITNEEYRRFEEFKREVFGPRCC